MTMHMPQEIEVWYVLPALRKTLATIFVKEKGMTQKATAKVLGLTEAAVSQYFNTKRGKDFQFKDKELKLIREGAENILKNPDNVMQQLFSLSKKLMGTKSVCEFHKSLDESLPKNCDVCNCEQ